MARSFVLLYLLGHAITALVMITNCASLFQEVG